MFSSLCCCFKFNSSTKFINKQHKDEYNKNNKLLKGDTFNIFNITYKNINDINDICDITQYDIYNAIQDYIHLYNTIPDNNNNLIIPC